MRIILALSGVLVIACWCQQASAAGTNDHFESRRRAAARAQQLQQQQQQSFSRRPWGGPTTDRNWWTPTRELQHRVVVPGRTFYAPGYYPPAYYYPYYPRTPLVPGRFIGPTIWPRHHIHIELRRDR